MTLNDDSLWLEEHVGCPPLIRLAGKRPLEVGWTFGPRQEPERWRAKLDGHRGNVGMVCGNGIVVVDVDVHKPNVDRSIAELERRGLPATFEARTGSGGRHLIYRADRPVASAPLKGFPGIDIKADGGQIVVAPSTHPDTGRAYEWVNGRTPAVWPAWLDPMCGQPNRPQPREQHQIVSGRQHGYHLEIAIF
jgi:hypothetical protein